VFQPKKRYPEFGAIQEDGISRFLLDHFLEVFCNDSEWVITLHRKTKKRFRNYFECTE